MPNRKRPTEEFKIEAVWLLPSRGESLVADIAESHGIVLHRVYRWRALYEKPAKSQIQHARETAEQAEIRKWR